MSNKLILRNKCLVLGNPGTGKSAVLQMFSGDGTNYLKNYSMTLQPEVIIKVVNIPETDVSVELYLHDIPGNDSFLEYFRKYADGANSFVLVFDVTNAESFKSLPKWIAMLKKFKSMRGPLPGVILANKTDLTARRVVASHQGEELAKQTGLGYFECSAANNTEVDSPFYFIASTAHETFEEHLKHFVKVADSVSS